MRRLSRRVTIISSIILAVVLIVGAWWGSQWLTWYRATSGRAPLVDERTYHYLVEPSDVTAAGYTGVTRQKQERLLSTDRFLLPKEYFRVDETDPQATSAQPNESYNIVAVNIIERQDGKTAPILDETRADQIIAAANPSLSVSADTYRQFVDGRVKLEFESGRYLISVSGPVPEKVRALALIIARKFAS